MNVTTEPMNRDFYPFAVEDLISNIEYNKDYNCFVLDINETYSREKMYRKYSIGIMGHTMIPMAYPLVAFNRGGTQHPYFSQGEVPETLGEMQDFIDAQSHDLGGNKLLLPNPLYMGNSSQAPFVMFKLYISTPYTTDYNSHMAGPLVGQAMVNV